MCVWYCLQRMIGMGCYTKLLWSIWHFTIAKELPSTYANQTVSSSIQANYVIVSLWMCRRACYRLFIRSIIGQLWGNLIQWKCLALKKNNHDQNLANTNFDLLHYLPVSFVLYFHTNKHSRLLLGAPRLLLSFFSFLLLFFVCRVYALLHSPWNLFIYFFFYQQRITREREREK